MKKILLPICAMLLCMTACKKDEGVLKLEIERYNTNAKVHIDDAHYAVWDNGDKIWLNGAEATVSISGNRGTIAIPESVAGATSYTAIYPYDWVEECQVYVGGEEPIVEVLMIKYQNQTYRTTIDGKQVVDAPMAAVSDGGTLRFTNLGSILAVTVSNPTDDPMSVTKIEVIANGDDVFINGRFPLSLDNDIRLDEIESSGTESNTITLDCQPVEIQRDGSHTFYIALPPMDNAMLTIKVYDYEGYYMRNQSGTVEVDYGQNQLNQVTFNIDDNVYHSCPIPNNQIWYTVSRDGEIDGSFDNVASHGENVDGSYFIEFNDDVYAISAYPFSRTTYLTSITLPQSVRYIEATTFRNLNRLQEVKCYSSSVTLGREVFDSRMTRMGILHLPEGANENAWIDAGWGGNISFDL